MTDDELPFAPPPFDPRQALDKLRRELREVRGLTHQGETFEWRGQTVVAWTLDETAVRVRLAKRPARTPQWEDRRLASAAEVRRFVEDVRRRVARWNDDE